MHRALNIRYGLTLDRSLSRAKVDRMTFFNITRLTQLVGVNAITAKSS